VPHHLFLHVPVIPKHYAFDKIGHYHHYVEDKKLRKQLLLFNRHVTALTQKSNWQKRFYLVCSIYTYGLLPDYLQQVIQLQIDWRFKQYTHAKEGGVLFKIPALETIDQTDGNLHFYDVGKQHLIKTSIPHTILNPNELQIEVLNILDALQDFQINNIHFHEQLNWFLNAEHILWMSKDNKQHVYSSPFSNAYDAYINVMNMLSDFKLYYGINA